MYYHKGRRHGLYRTFRVDKNFEEMGLYINGHLYGDFILKCEGNSYMIGRHPSNCQQDGCKEFVSICTYLYPDMESCIFGFFEFKKHLDNMNVCELNADLKLRHGSYGKITDITWSYGFPLLKSRPQSDDVFVYDPSTGLRIRYAKWKTRKSHL